MIFCIHTVDFHRLGHKYYETVHIAVHRHSSYTKVATSWIQYKCCKILSLLWQKIKINVTKTKVGIKLIARFY